MLLSRASPSPLTNRTRVLHVVPQLEVGGLEGMAIEFAKHTNREAFELLFVCLGERGRPAESIEAQGIKVITLHTAHGLKLSLLKSLLRVIRDFSPSVIHAHNTRAFFYAGLAGKMTRVPVIGTQHSRRFPKRGRQGLLFKLATRLLNQLVCVSQDSRNAAEEFGPAKRPLCVRNGIDLARFSDAGCRAGMPAVSVGRLSREKDYGTLIQATKLVVEKRPDFELEIYGAGPCLGELEALVAAANLGRNVRFPGATGQVAEKLSGKSFFVLSSLTEGISLAILEAMASGLPVVATRVGGTPEVVEHGKTGLLVPPENPRELAEAMLAMLEVPAITRRMGEASRSRVEREFEIGRSIRQYEALYRSCR